MVTKKSLNSTPVELVGNAEDEQKLSTVEPADASVVEQTEPVAVAAEEVAAEPAAENETIAESIETASAAKVVEPEQTVEAVATTEDVAAHELTADSEDKTEIAEIAGMSKTELVDLLEEKIKTEQVQTLRRLIEAVKVAFYKLHRADGEAAAKAFVEQNGEDAEYVAPVDEQEQRLKSVLRDYRARRDAYIAESEHLKEDNYKLKLKIVEELKELTDSDETLNHTFAKFRELQTRWRETGAVPQQYVNDLWENYNLQVEKFYGFIKINKELRDLDLKKNLETKTDLCEQAEKLMLEPSIVEAFHQLQKLHDQWRETGPVANEFKDALWERFKAASSRINKQHQEFFERIKDEQQRNLDLKEELCKKAEALAETAVEGLKDWTKPNDELLEIQKVWKTIGFAPKKDNAKIYERFRAACDKFFERKREFFTDMKDGMEQNLRIKEQLCEQAEALQESEEWKKTTEELLALQARWKEAGAVSRRNSEKIWKRFRAACDKFFQRKQAHFSTVDEQYEQNLQLKRALIDEMNSAELGEGGYDTIKEFQRRWSEVGFVPMKVKDEIQKGYKTAVDRLFGMLRGSEHDRSISRFKDKLSNIKGAGDKRLKMERERLYNKVRQLEQDIALLENNIGFFAKSKNAEAMIKDVQAKIEKAKRDMAEAVEKVRMIDKNSNED